MIEPKSACNSFAKMPMDNGYNAYRNSDSNNYNQVNLMQRNKKMNVVSPIKFMEKNKVITSPRLKVLKNKLKFKNNLYHDL